MGPLLLNILCECNANRDFLPKEISRMTTCTSKVLGALPRFPRALASLGGVTYRASTLRQPRHPNSIVLKLPVRVRSARHSPLLRSFGLARCLDMRISSSPICQVCPRLSGPFSLLPDPWLLPLAWPIWWKLNHGQTKARPVHVRFDTVSVLRFPYLNSSFPPSR